MNDRRHGDARLGCDDRDGIWAQIAVCHSFRWSPGNREHPAWVGGPYNPCRGRQADTRQLKCVGLRPEKRSNWQHCKLDALFGRSSPERARDGLAIKEQFEPALDETPPTSESRVFHSPRANRKLRHGTSGSR